MDPNYFLWDHPDRDRSAASVAVLTQSTEFLGNFKSCCCGGIADIRAEIVHTVSLLADYLTDRLTNHLDVRSTSAGRLFGKHLM
jgi:hypothetical protein